MPCRRGRGSAWHTQRHRHPGGPRSRPRRARRRGWRRSPKLRVPITGLSGLLLTSATGPRSRSMPTAASSEPTTRPVSRVRTRSSAAPSAAGPSTGLPVRACSRVTSPPSSSTATRARGATARIEAVSFATASGPSAVLLPNRQTPPRPSANSSAQSAGSVVPGNAGSSTASASRSRSALIPSHPRP